MDERNPTQEQDRAAERREGGQPRRPQDDPAAATERPAVPPAPAETPAPPARAKKRSASNERET